MLIVLARWPELAKWLANGGRRALEHFPAKWQPLCVVKMRQNKDL
jgi:hypothetical protein